MPDGPQIFKWANLDPNKMFRGYISVRRQFQAYKTFSLVHSSSKLFFSSFIILCCGWWYGASLRLLLVAVYCWPIFLTLWAKNKTKVAHSPGSFHHCIWNGTHSVYCFRDQLFPTSNNALFVSYSSCSMSKKLSKLLFDIFLVFTADIQS